MDDRKGVEDTLAGPPPDPSDALARGAALDRYIVLEKLGAGGMGVVYSAYDPELNRRVAIKLVRHAETPEGESIGRSRLLREAQAIARVSHPNVVAVYDVGTFRDHVFIAMELVDGETLTEWLHGRAQSIAEIGAIFGQAGRGLEAAHAAGLVHRDFKPDNVLVGRDGRVRVADFGLVQSLGDEEAAPLVLSAARPESAHKSVPDPLATPLTQTGAFLGTPAYMAPEQFRRAHTDARSDQFSFCVALHEALFGERPFAGDDFATIAREVLAHRLRAPSVRRSVPAHLRALIKRGLAAAPGDRFASMTALLVELGRDPALVRRRVGVVVAGVALLALGVGVQRIALRRRADSCAGARDLIAKAWSPEQRAAMRSAFLETGAPYADDALRSVTRVLEAYADEWAAARTSACEATRVRGEQSEERLDQRVACLDDRREELRALTELLGRADRPLVLRAPRAARSLDPVSDCAADALFRDRPRPPVGAEARAAVEALRKELARVHVLLDTGRYADGRAQIAPIIARAAALHYRPVEAEALHLKGMLEQESGEPALSLATLEDAALAAQAGRADETAARALTDMAVACDDLGQTDRGLEWARQAAAMVERLGDPPKLKAALEHALGDLTQSRGEWDASASHFRRALALLVPLEGSLTHQGAVHNNLALAYEGQGKSEDALAEAKKAYEIFKTELGGSHPQVATALNNVGYYEMRLGRAAEARAAIERALAIAEAALGPDHPKLALELNNLCELERDAGRFDEAQARCERALAIRRKAFGDEHPEVASTYGTLGDLARARGDRRGARQYYERSLAMREKLLGAHHPYVVESLVALGDLNLEDARPELAIAPLTRAASELSAPDKRVDLLWVQFLLERARARGAGGHARVRAAAEAARAAMAPLAAMHRDQLATLDKWLAEDKP